MGLLDWLWNRRYERLPTRVYLTEGAKWNGLCGDVAHCRGQDGLVVVAAHFPATLQAAAQALETVGLEYRVLQERLDDARLRRLMAGERSTPVVLTLVELLEAGERYVAEETESSVAVLVAERHPLPSHDEKPAAFARSLACRCRLADYVSLEDALLRRFAGDRVAGMLRALGMPESDVIHSGMVTRRIRTAQRRIGRIARGDDRADSAEEWLRQNCPESADPEK